MQKPLIKPDIEAQLASALGRRDEVPNVELAKQIAQANDAASVTSLATVLQNGAKAVRQDAIKVFYEIGTRNPPLILSQLPVLLNILTSKNNRLVWGGMAAVATLSEPFPDKIFPHLNRILAAADAGSVIAKDRLIDILVALTGVTAYSNEIMPIIVARLQTSAVNQLPMYAEKVARLTLDHTHAAIIISTLESRMCEPMSPSKKKRLEKTIQSLSQSNH